MHAKVLCCELLVLIVRCNFGCVDDSVSHNIRTNTNPKASKTFFSNNLRVAIHRTCVGSLFNWKTALCLKTNFDDISRIRDGDSNSACRHSCENLLEERWIHARSKWTSNHISDWNVTTNFDTAENNLTLKPRNQSLVKTLRSFLSKHFGHCTEHANVLGFFP